MLNLSDPACVPDANGLSNSCSLAHSTALCMYVCLLLTMPQCIKKLYSKPKRNVLSNLLYKYSTLGENHVDLFSQLIISFSATKKILNKTYYWIINYFSNENFTERNILPNIIIHRTILPRWNLLDEYFQTFYSDFKTILLSIFSLWLYHTSRPQ